MWTLHYQPIVSMKRLWQEYEESEAKRDEYFGSDSLGLALHVVNTVVAGAFRKLERLAKHIDIAEDAIFHGHERQMVEEVSLLMRDVMDFRKITRSQIDLFKSPADHALFTPETNAQWRRLNGQMQKTWDILEGLLESTKELEKTNSRLLQHKENELLRMLTYYSIFSIPALYIFQAVNPFSGNQPKAIMALYWGLLGVLVIVLAIIFTRFKRKRVL
jgi:Mg2+ and Co2+ transporter CorA